MFGLVLLELLPLAYLGFWGYQQPSDVKPCYTYLILLKSGEIVFLANQEASANRSRSR